MAQAYAAEQDVESAWVREIELNSERRTQLMDITAMVQGSLNGSNGASAVLVYVPHTTAGVTIQEHADPAVARDLERALERVIDDDWSWQHIEEGEGNAPSHVRASLMAPQVAVPL